MDGHVVLETQLGFVNNQEDKGRNFILHIVKMLILCGLSLELAMVIVIDLIQA